MLFLAECIRIFTTWQAIPFKRKFYYFYSTLQCFTRQFRVSKEINEACPFEAKVWMKKTAMIVQQIVPPYNMYV